MIAIRSRTIITANINLKNCDFNDPDVTGLNFLKLGQEPITHN